MSVWSSGFNLQGKIGAMLRYGVNAPTATDGNDGDSWIATSTGRLYAVKSGGAWPNTYATLAAAPGKDGAAGAQFTFGTATPGATYGAVGDVYLKTTDYTIYNKVSTGWQSLGSLKGATGDTGAASTVAGPQGKPGSVIYTITGAPSTTNPSTQADGDYAFQTDAANGPTFFGPRASGTFPSSGTSLRGLQGVKGDTGSIGATGPASPGLYSGSGVPSSSNPSGTQVDGSYYIRNDVNPALLYGPRANGVWPTSGQNTGGSQTQTTNGPPAATLGAVGDVAYDLTNAFFYPPKTSNGWTTAPINLVGPTGPAGLSFLSSQSAGNGPSVGMSGTTVSATAIAAYYPGTAQALTYTPSFVTQFIGYSITNPGVALTLSLVNITTGATVLSVSVAANVTTGNYFALGTYPTMPANNGYQWTVTGSGAASFCLTPLYMMPAVSQSYNVSSLPSVGKSTSTTFSSTALQLQYPGSTTGNAFRLAKAGYLYAATLTNLSSASLTFVLNYSTNGGSSYSTLYSVAAAANTASNVGPFTASNYATASASVMYWSVTGTGTGTCFVDTQLVYVG